MRSSRRVTALAILAFCVSAANQGCAGGGTTTDDGFGGGVITGTGGTSNATSASASAVSESVRSRTAGTPLPAG